MLGAARPGARTRVNALDGDLARLLGALLLLLLEGIFAAFEMSLIKLRFSHFNQDLLEALRSQARLARWFDRAGALQKTARAAQSLCLAGYLLLLVPVGVAAARSGLGAVGAWVLVVLAALLLNVVVAQLLPRGLGLAYPLAIMRMSVRLTATMRFLLWPFLRSADALAQLLLKPFKATGAAATLDSLDVEGQLAELGHGSDVSSEVARRVLRNALTMRGLEVSDVLLPRSLVQYFDLADSNEYNLNLARKTGHTRFPLCEGDLDQCIGLIHIKDIFRSREDPRAVDFRRLKREIIRLDQSMQVAAAMQELLRNKMHMALVTNEFGGVEGVVTLERILEILVGEIQDEFDTEEAPIRPLGNGEYAVAGLAPVHAVEEALGISFDNEEVSTFGGLVTAELGRFPRKGERLDLDGLAIVVSRVDQRRVIELRVRPLDSAAEGDAGEGI